LEKSGLYRTAIKAAKEKNPEYFTGGRDIMKKLQEKLTGKKKKGPPGYVTDGFGILRKWEQEKQHKAPSDPTPQVGEGFDVMKQVVKHPVSVKK